jgi:alkanesulfonate monooxygenase SsuD/methylene tetrahydromethanopterin reductase-like flavin-dependent oxidoreductase (luciferase family)
MAGAVADGIIVVMVTVDRIRQLRKFLDESARAAGRRAEDVQIVAMLQCYVRDNGEEARAMVPPMRLAELPFYQRPLRESGIAIKEGRVEEKAVDSLAVAGSPDFVRERLAAYEEAGVNVGIFSMRDEATVRYLLKLNAT